MRQFIYATAMLLGAIVGVGTFGIPYVSSRAGFWVGEAYIGVVLLGAILMNLCYGEVVERTAQHHRIVGYVGMYLGRRAKYLCVVLVLASGYAALLLYIIAAGKFLNILSFNALPVFWGSMLFWIVGAIFLWFGLRMIASGEAAMTALLVLTLGIVIARGLPFVHLQNFTPPDFPQIFLPYGVVLFAMSGTYAIPEMRRLLSDGKKYPWAILLGTFLAGLLYAVFNFVVVGISGAHTSTQAIEGITPVVGQSIAWIGALAGFLAIATSYVVFCLNLKDMLIFDWRFSTGSATTLIAFVPLLLFLLGLQQFIEVMSVAGGVFGAAIAIFSLLVYLRAKKQGNKTPAFSLGLPKAIVYTIIAALSLAGVYQIIYWVR